jgi:tRNA1(Val) A37 N6-methylase TrmN6
MPITRPARKVSDQKRTGAHFTPADLADFVAERIMSYLEFSEGQVDVLDPACGDGELLRAFWSATPARHRHRVMLRGIEHNQSPLKAAKARLASLGARSEFIHGDFISNAQPAGMPNLFNTNKNPRNRKVLVRQPHVIIANPPYVRTQILGSDRSKDLARRFGLRGRVDLYHVFLIAMTEALEPGGLIGVITSNRFLTTRGGEALRQELATRFELLEIIDLGDTKMFSAAVLPAIIIAKKRLSPVFPAPSEKTRFIKIYEGQKENRSTEAVPAATILETIQYGRDGQYLVNHRSFNVSSGHLTLGVTAREPWRMTTLGESGWMTRIERAARFRIGDVAKVRVGIKTTADGVFIRPDWTSIAESSRPESTILRPLLTHHDASRWISATSNDNLVQIAYTHVSVDGKRMPINLKHYPRTKAYFESHRQTLEERKYVTKSGRQWYEIWVPQDPVAWQNPKIVFPDISAEPRFFLDETGALVNGDCYWISLDPAQIDLLLLIQGVANSILMTKYHDLAFNNRLYSGRRRYISQYVERYPLPDPTSASAKEIVKIVKRLNQRPSVENERRLNDAVERSFGF